MITRFVNDLRSAPELINERVAQLLEELKTAPERLTDAKDDAIVQARNRLHIVRGTVETSVFETKAFALETASDLLGQAAEAPVVGAALAPAKVLVDDALAAVVNVPVAEYADMNVRNVRKSIKDLGRVDLLRVQRFEAANKARKTVLDAVERELERCDELIEA